MKLWTSGEIDAIIGDEFRIAMNKVEELVNTLLNNSSYGEGMANWDVIYIISSIPRSEIFKYNYKRKESDIKVVVDFEAFKNAPSVQKEKILLNALVKSVIFVTEKNNITDFDFKQLIHDLNNLIGYEN